MIRSIALLLVCGVTMALTGCGGGGSQAEQSVKDVTASFNQLADRLEKITSKEQFAQAEADLKVIGERVKSAMEQMKVLETIPKEENDRIGQTLGADMAKARSRVIEQTARIGSTIDPLAADRIAVFMGFDK